MKKNLFDTITNVFVGVEYAFIALIIYIEHAYVNVVYGRVLMNIFNYLLDTNYAYLYKEDAITVVLALAIMVGICIVIFRVMSIMNNMLKKVDDILDEKLSKILK